MSDVAVSHHQLQLELPKLQEVHTSPYFQQKETRKRSQSEASVDSGYSAGSPMEVTETESDVAEPDAVADPWGFFKSREAFLEMHVC